MRLGVFGGSFDPVHHGHLLLAECCWRQAQLDRVDFVPAARQPHKPSGAEAANEDRLAMLRLAIAGKPQFSVSSIEIERGGPSFTVDTLRELHNRLPTAELFFLMGADALADFPKWREPEEICRLATPLIVHRAGAAEPRFDALLPLVGAERVRDIRAVQVEMPPTPISSSEIRRLIACEGDWQSMLPAAVAEYIASRRLYAS